MDKQQSKPISILTLNSNGLFKTMSKKYTSSRITEELKERIEDSTITCISDTHLDEEGAQKMEKIFKKHLVIATTSTKKRAGTAILVSKDRFKEKPKKVTFETGYMTKPNRETDGPRYTIATIQEEESTRKLIVASVYGPTASNKLTFFKDFLDKIEDHRSAEPTSDIIIAGDLNLHLDRLTQPTLAKNELLASMKRLKMIDTFRSLNKGKNGYTYWGRQGNTPSRIDYILVSETLIKHRAISETVSGASFQSDHDAVTTQLDRPTRRGKKKANPRPFNDRMLSIKNFRSELEERLQVRLKGSQTGDKKDDDTLKTIQQNQPAHVQTLEEVYNIIEEVIRPLEKSFTRNYKNRLRRRR